MKKILLFACLLVAMASFLCAQNQDKSGEFTYDRLEVYGNNGLISYDDRLSGTYQYAYESRCCKEDSCAYRYGVAGLVMISNCTKGTLSADSSKGSKKAVMISDKIGNEKESRSVTGAIYWSSIYRGSDMWDGKAKTFLYAHYFLFNDPSIKDTGRPVYFTMRCWNQRTIKFDPKSGDTGLETAKSIIEKISEAGAFAPYVGHFIHAFGLISKYLIHSAPPPDPNDYVYRLNGYLVTANPKNADCVPQWSTLYGKDGKPSYDSYAMQVAGGKDTDAASNYVVQNSCIRSVDLENGCNTIPVYVINIYYANDYYGSKLKTYCEYIHNLGYDKENKDLALLTDKMIKADMNKLSNTFDDMSNDDMMKVNDAIEFVFKSHNNNTPMDQVESSAKYQEAIRLLGDI